jgi:ketosteroid isomerase-like protein
MYAAFGHGDIAALLSDVSAEVDWRINVDLEAPGARRVPMFTPRRGHEGVRDFFAVLAKSVQIHRFEPLSFLSNESEAVARLIVDATILPTGRRMSTETIHHFTFDQAGKLTRFVDFFDTLGDAAAWGAI